MRVIEASDADLGAVLAVSRAAFGGEDVPALVRELLVDPSARPLLSLVARDDGPIIGHALFTAARLSTEEAPGSAVILAPLAVIPDAQGRGVGRFLLREGLRFLRDGGVRLVFLAGHPGYYARHGFMPAYPQGFTPPFLVSPAEAWMVRSLEADALGSTGGVVACATAMDKAEHWRE
ncbi:MAG TPA: N-acetyltransferase [Thermoleophilia bacterium]